MFHHDDGDDDDDDDDDGGGGGGLVERRSLQSIELNDAWDKAILQLFRACVSLARRWPNTTMRKARGRQSKDLGLMSWLIFTLVSSWDSLLTKV